MENSAENHAEETAQAGTCLVTETFTGSINGGGHKVSGMKSAMFKQLSGKVENLEFRNILVDNETSRSKCACGNDAQCKCEKRTFQRNYTARRRYTGMMEKIQDRHLVRSVYRTQT